MAYLPKSKKTFFKDNSKGKKAFPGGLKGPKQPKYHKTHGKKLVQKKMEKVKTPTQINPMGVARPAQKRQEMLVGKPRQPRYQMDQDIMRRIRRATS